MKNERKTYTFVENVPLARQIAAEGMVLLKNDNETLPLAGKRVAVFGRGQVEYFKGGHGSADVKSAYALNLYDGLCEKDAEGKIFLAHDCSKKYFDSIEYMPTAEELEEFAAVNDVALVVISRNSGEGNDTLNIKGDFLLSDEETELLNRLEKSPFTAIIVVINAGRVISLEFSRSDRIGALVYMWQAGMEGGAAAADLLTGDVNFSGKLADTFAGKFEDYPCFKTWSNSASAEVYSEDIYVGYRYFETIPGAKERVLYPFGFGLSYTEFQFDRYAFEFQNGSFKISCRVTNTGKTAGREVVQLYSSLTGGRLDHPAVELRDYSKTSVLQPGESETVIFSLPRQALRSFDDSGIVAGKPGCWIIDSGTYTFKLGNSVRNTVEIGQWTCADVELLEHTGILFAGIMSKRMLSDGTYLECGFTDNHPFAERKRISHEPQVFSPPILLEDVALKRASMDDFISQLSVREMASLCCGQPAAFSFGTAGIGKLLKFGVPNPQTCDGPAGLRKSVPTTCFPCETLVACSWDRQLQFAMGEAMGKEGIATGVDVQLAPGMNIHRSPLCGRNFEYYSEDPLISGRAAAAVIQGMQSQGLGASLKHFALHNRDTDRYDYSSQVSERALREIYLGAFEIAIKVGKPWCIMSSYNLLNNIKCSCNYNLLTRLLRDEWGFDGVVMTDWTNNTALWREIAAGNDLKMPMAPDFDESMIYIRQGSIEFESLRTSVRRVLELVMKTQVFKKQEFGRLISLNKMQTHRVKCADFSATAVTQSYPDDCDDVDGGVCMLHLAPLPWRPNQPVTFFYRMQIENAGKYKLRFRYAVIQTGCRLIIKLDNEKIGTVHLEPGSSFADWKTSEDIEISLPAGEHEFSTEVHGFDPVDWKADNFSGKLNWFELQ